MNLTGSRVLVIGGAGFIGSHVVSELLQTDVSQVVVSARRVRSLGPRVSLKFITLWLHLTGTSTSRFLQVSS